MNFAKEIRGREMEILQLVADFHNGTIKQEDLPNELFNVPCGYKNTWFVLATEYLRYMADKEKKKDQGNE